MATRTPRRRRNLPTYPGPAHPERLPNRTKFWYTPEPDRSRPEIPGVAPDDEPCPPSELATPDALAERQVQRQAAADDYARLELDMLIGRYEAEPQRLTHVREKLTEYRSLRAALDEPEGLTLHSDLLAWRQESAVRRENRSHKLSHRHCKR
jgi:hypothetical protein